MSRLARALSTFGWLPSTVPEPRPPAPPPASWQDVADVLHRLDGLVPEDRELLKRLTFTAYSALHHRDSLPVRPEAA